MSNTKQTQTTTPCIRCGKEDTVIRRGLCQKHYGEFRTAKLHVAENELELWEASLIAKGLILPDARKATNPYINTLAELRAQTGSVAASELPSASDEAEQTDLTKTPVGRKKTTKKQTSSAPDADEATKTTRKRKSG